MGADQRRRKALQGLHCVKLATLATSQAEAPLHQAELALALRALEFDDDDDVFATESTVGNFAASAAGIAVEVDDSAGDARRLHTARAAPGLLSARLGGAAVSRRTLDDMRTEHSEDALLVALSAVADAPD